MSDDGKTLASFRVDEETYDVAMSKLAHGEMSERLRETILEIAHGAETTEAQRVKANLEEWRDERDELDANIQKMRSNRRTVERKISRAEDRLNNLQKQDGEYDGSLAMLESRLHDGTRVHGDDGQVKEAARQGECDPGDVLNDLRERNPEVPECAYREAKPEERANWKEELGWTHKETLRSAGDDENENEDRDR